MLGNKKTIMTKLRLTSKTLDTVGTLLLSFVLFSLHNKFKIEREIDDSVLQEMENEQIVVVIALVFFALSWVLSVIEEFEESYRHKVLMTHDPSYQKIENIIIPTNGISFKN
jgi:hypothetical protein